MNEWEESRGRENAIENLREENATERDKKLSKEYTRVKMQNKNFKKRNNLAKKIEKI